MTSPPAQEFRSLLAAAAAVTRPDLPLRLLVRRRAPLMSQGERLGHLDALLRLSCHGDGHGSGVLVFDWPTTAHGHSVLRLLEDFSKRHGNDTNGRDSAFRIEHGENNNGTPPGASVHLKVFFDAAAIPDEMLELLGLAQRMDLVRPAREEIGRYPPAKAAPAAAQNGVHAAAPVPTPPEPTASTPPAPEPAPPAAPHPEQDKIDRIVNHAQFDGNLHPHVDPNVEVVNSNGEAFRLIMRRGRGGLRRQWMRISKELAPN